MATFGQVRNYLCVPSRRCTLLLQSFYPHYLRVVGTWCLAFFSMTYLTCPVRLASGPESASAQSPGLPCSISGMACGRIPVTYFALHGQCVVHYLRLCSSLTVLGAWSAEYAEHFRVDALCLTAIRCLLWFQLSCPQPRRCPPFSPAGWYLNICSNSCDYALLACGKSDNSCRFSLVLPLTLVGCPIQMCREVAHRLTVRCVVVRAPFTRCWQGLEQLRTSVLQ